MREINLLYYCATVSINQSCLNSSVVCSINNCMKLAELILDLIDLIKIGFVVEAAKAPILCDEIAWTKLLTSLSSYSLIYISYLFIGHKHNILKVTSTKLTFTK